MTTNEGNNSTAYIKDDADIVFHIFDTNLFRKACKSKGGQFIINMNSALEQHKELKNEDVIAIKLTPFGLLEYLGIVPPHPGIIELPAKLKNSTDHMSIGAYIVNEAKRFYESRKELKLDYLNQKALEQEAYVEPEATSLFNICVKNLLSHPATDLMIINFLAFDYLYKYIFTKKHEQIMAQFYSSQFFLDDDFTSSLSKFRFTKRIWDKYYSSVTTTNPNAETIDIFDSYNKSMAIKNQRDYLDGDLVHYLAYGAKQNGKRCKVVAFTCDDASHVRDRVLVHRSMGMGIYSNYEEAVKHLYKDIVNHKGGVIVACDDEGHFSKIIDLSSLVNIGALDS